LERQQYGHWIKAPLFSLAKRQVLEVKGYELVTVRAPIDQSARGGAPVSIGLNQHPSIPLIQGVEGGSLGPRKSTTVVELFGGGGAIWGWQWRWWWDG